MDAKEKVVYVEVYNILQLLGKEYINKLPKSLYKMIKDNGTNSVDSKYCKYKSLKEINKNNISKESLAMIALFHTNYWCDTLTQKEELRKIFSDNFIKNEKEKREKYNPDNIFKKRKRVAQEKVELIQYKENIWKRIINKIKHIINKKWYKKCKGRKITMRP